MKMYIIDAGTAKEGLTEPDTFISENLVLETGLLRGYTLSPLTARMYYNQLSRMMGKYVIIKVFEYDVEDRKSKSDYDTIALDLCNELIKSDEIRYSASCEELILNQLENGGYIVSTEAMLEVSSYTFNGIDILEEYVFLFSNVFNYFNLSRDETFNEFRKFILEELPSRVYELYTIDGRWSVDPYAVFNYFFSKLLFV